ncbi:hypothetical protein DPMN_032886 [Dreissena polymorpha]|uniref:Uncharacterized protein n=1 Tax=Dreissena polymorpha TaxID=45954 RepID=A0A9D4RIE5_DREPO|nr:hypothetical protein DPMN_104805 [Dreissena polymorpha]KAH3869716.1 hypothetical protein DPMN_032886 [Dreissena polymorpha]
MYSCSTKSLYPFQDISHAVCSYCRLPLPSAKDAVLHCAHEHQNEKVDPGESRQSPGIPSLRRHSPGLYGHQTPTELRQRPGLTGDNRGSTGKVFKCSIPLE